MTQRTWRTVGILALAVCGILAWYGFESGVANQRWPIQAAYWLVFLLALLVTFYVVLLDLRYTRLQYIRGEKEVFEETLGSEEFRRALLRSRRKGTGDATRGPGEDD